MHMKHRKTQPRRFKCLTTPRRQVFSDSGTAGTWVLGDDRLLVLDTCGTGNAVPYFNEPYGIHVRNARYTFGLENHHLHGVNTAIELPVHDDYAYDDNVLTNAFTHLRTYLSTSFMPILAT